MRLHATGHLQHQFLGEYSAAIGLIFETPAYARLALPKLAPRDLGVAWRIASSEPRSVVISVTSDQLQKLKTHLGTLGADEDAIDSVAHSIDYGDPFTIDVDLEDPRQLALFSLCHC